MLINYYLDHKMILPLLVAPLAVVLGWLLQKSKFSEKVSQISVFSISIVLLTYSFLLPKDLEWLRGIFVTFSSISLAFWLSSQNNKNLELNRCKAFLSLMCNEMDSNKDLLADIIKDYKFVISSKPIVWRLTRARQDAIGRRIKILRTNVWNLFISTGLIYRLPSSEAVNQLEAAYNRLNHLKSASDNAIAVIDLKLSVVEEITNLPPEVMASYAKNIESHLLAVKYQLVWSIHYMDIAFEGLKEYLHRVHQVGYETVADNLDYLTDEEKAAIGSVEAPTSSVYDPD